MTVALGVWREHGSSKSLQLRGAGEASHRGESEEDNRRNSSRQGGRGERALRERGTRHRGRIHEKAQVQTVCRAGTRGGRQGWKAVGWSQTVEASGKKGEIGEIFQRWSLLDLSSGCIWALRRRRGGRGLLAAGTANWAHGAALHRHGFVGRNRGGVQKQGW